MEKINLQNQPKEVLSQQLKEAVNHLAELKFQVSANQLKNVREIRKVKQMIARIKTFLHKKSLKV